MASTKIPNLPKPCRYDVESCLHFEPEKMIKYTWSLRVPPSEAAVLRGSTIHYNPSPKAAAPTQKRKLNLSTSHNSLLFQKQKWNTVAVWRVYFTCYQSEVFVWRWATEVKITSVAEKASVYDNTKFAGDTQINQNPVELVQSILWWSHGLRLVPKHTAAGL